VKLKLSLQYNRFVTLILEPTTAVPLSQDASGVVRVGGTRVTLATVIYAWQQGHSAEEILEQFPSLQLSDIHAVLVWVLRHSQQSMNTCKNMKLPRRTQFLSSRRTRMCGRFGHDCVYGETGSVESETALRGTRV
jgi:uncharacterized protein (DUF433 family)